MDEVFHRDMAALVAFGDVDHQAHIGFDETAAGGLVTVLDGPGEHNLTFRAEQGFLRQAVQVAGDTFFFVHGGRIDLHRLFGLDREK